MLSGVAMVLVLLVLAVALFALASAAPPLRGGGFISGAIPCPPAGPLACAMFGRD